MTKLEKWKSPLWASSSAAPFLIASAHGELGEGAGRKQLSRLAFAGPKMASHFAVVTSSGPHERFDERPPVDFRFDLLGDHAACSPP
jgi:hypothetical protein